MANTKSFCLAHLEGLEPPTPGFEVQHSIQLSYRYKIYINYNIKNLKIDKNEDYVTLLTCTPYGINTKRLLVRGKRIKTINQKRFVTTEGFKINKLIAIPIIAAPVVLILIIILIIKPVKKIDLKKYDIYLYPNGRD